MGFIGHAKEVLEEQVQLREDIEWVLAFFNLLEWNATNVEDSMKIPDEVASMLKDIQERHGFASYEQLYWQVNFLVHQFMFDQVPNWIRDQTERKAAKFPRLLNDFEHQLALTWVDSWEKTIFEEIDLEGMPVLGHA